MQTMFSYSTCTGLCGGSKQDTQTLVTLGVPSIAVQCIPNNSIRQSCLVLCLNLHFHTIRKGNLVAKNISTGIKKSENVKYVCYTG